jgi:drug/metabolite transporter (DMT)-like permease
MEPAPPSGTATAPVPPATPSPEPAASAIATWGAFTGCVLIWGSTFLVIRVGNDALPPLWAAALRLALAALVLAGIARLTGQPRPRGAAAAAATWYGLLVFGLNFPLLYWGETGMSSGLSAVMFSTVPLTAPLFAHAFGVERIVPLKLLAALIGVVGVVVIFAGEIHGAVPVAPFLAVLGAATAGSLGTVLLKRGPRQSPIVVNAWGSLLGLPLVLAASFALGEPHPLPTTTAQIAPLLYLTVAGSVGAFVLMSWLVHRWPITRISFIPILAPTLAVFLGAFVRHERLGPAGALGSLLVLAGVGVSVATDRRLAGAAARH